MNYQNGSTYTGNWIKGKQFGKGKFTFANGDYYEGQWESGKMHGRGVFVKVSGGAGRK